MDGGQIDSCQALPFHKGVLTNGLHLGQVNSLQRDTAGEGVLRDLGDGFIQANLLQLTAVGKGISTDALRVIQADGLQGRCVISIHVVTITTDRGILHGIIQADIIHIAGEGVFTNGNYLGQVNILQTRAVIECQVADGNIFAQSHSFQVCSAAEGIFTDHSVIADGQLLQSGSELIVEIAFTILIVMLNRISKVLIDGKGVIANGHIITDRHACQVQAFAEHAFRNGHTTGNGDRCQSRAREGVFADLGVGGDGGHLGDTSLEEGIFADLGQLAKRNRGQVLIGCQGVVPYHGHLGQYHRSDLGIMGEGAVCQGRNCHVANVGSGESAGNGRRYSH